MNDRKPSGYSASGANDETVIQYSVAGAFGYATVRDGMITEPGDEEEPRYIDGMAELRANARKASERH